MDKEYRMFKTLGYNINVCVSQREKRRYYRNKITELPAILQQCDVYLRKYMWKGLCQLYQIHKDNVHLYK